MKKLNNDDEGEADGTTLIINTPYCTICLKHHNGNCLNKKGKRVLKDTYISEITINPYED